MKIGLFLVLFPERELDELLPYLASKGVTAAELYVGALSDGSRHCDAELLLSDGGALKNYKKTFERHGIAISALNASGNPVHPVKEIAQMHDGALRRAFRLAERLEVDRVLAFSGCPGGCPSDRTPNWVGCPWPDEYLDILRYQWDEVLVPYWKDAVSFAKTRGIGKIGIEMHPGFCVYNPETLLKLRSLVGEEIGANLDPSHLMWQGIEAHLAAKMLSGAIHHVHIKDVRINDEVVGRTGVIDSKHYSDINNRAWVFATAGYGHSALDWKKFINALYAAGYDYVLSIEHEDSYMSRNEGFEKGVEFLKQVAVGEAPEKMWWA